MMSVAWSASIRYSASLTASACSAARRSEMSTICEMKYCGAPSASQTTLTPSATQTSRPSAARYRFSVR